jgi:hypothetical protein
MSEEQVVNIIQEEDKKQTKGKTFREYYADPEFKRKHLEYVNARTRCECGKMITRANISVHKKTPLHAKLLKEIPTDIRQFHVLLDRFVGEMKKEGILQPVKNAKTKRKTN